MPAAPRRRVLLALGYYDQHLHRGTARYARQAGWILETHMAHYGVLPMYWQGDGILTLLMPHRADLTDYIRDSTVPVVDLTHDVDLELPRVMLDNEKIGQMAASHLMDRGFENLAFLKFTAAMDVREREAGFANAVRSAGRTLHRLDWHAFSSSRAGREANWMDWLARELPKLPKPIGVMAQSDSKAVVFLNACLAAGMRIPEQVAVVGVDNDELACEFAPVPLSSVDSNREELAYAGAALLDRMMEGTAPPVQPQRISPNCVVARESSNILAIGHVQVAAALRFIWQHYHEPITVKHVVAACPMSRCGLYSAFEKHVGRPLAEEIARKRVEHARRLLAESDEKIHTIATMSGFSSGEHLSRAFTRLTGQTPSEYRKAHCA